VITGPVTHTAIPRVRVSVPLEEFVSETLEDCELVGSLVDETDKERLSPDAVTDADSDTA
jgi:hypothetical protein